MKPILNTPVPFPTPEVLQSVMGENFENYQGLADFFVRQNLVMEWNYYKDGKAWLCKVLHKKKNLCWLSVWENCFKLTFYFTEKHLEGIANLDISEQITEDFCRMKPVGKLLPRIIAVESMHEARLLNDIEAIVLFKMKCK